MEYYSNIETQNQLNKKRKESKFNKTPIKEFVTTKTKAEWGHLCDLCTKKRYCFYGNAIIIKCQKYSQITKVEKPYKKKYR